MLKSSEQSRVSDLPHIKHEEIFSHNNFPGVSAADQLIEQQLWPEKTFSKTDLQQSCSQELAKELDLINGGFYDFQEKAIRVIGSHLLNIVCDTAMSDDEKYVKIKELYEHNEMYWILWQYGLKHVALIKLIEKLKHHSYGLTREQIKLLEKYGMPEHVKNIKLFLESQLKIMPPTTRQQKQDLIYKIIEVASLYNMALPEEQWITEPELHALGESMSDLLYNVATVESDRKQMLNSIDLNDNREKAVDHFGNNYVREMIYNDKVMNYSAKLDHFLQTMTMLSQEMGTLDRIAMAEIMAMRKPNFSDNLKVFAKFYGQVRLWLLAPHRDLVAWKSTSRFTNIELKNVSSLTTHPP